MLKTLAEKVVAAKLKQFSTSLTFIFTVPWRPLKGRLFALSMASLVTMDAREAVRCGLLIGYSPHTKEVSQ